MDALTEHTGTCVPLRRSDVDTDQIIPARLCRKLTKTGFEDALFNRWRKDPSFVLNEPARAGASILLAGPNFGTGSSREHAVWALRDWGFRAVIAPNFGDIFLRNALRNGLLAVQLPTEAVSRMLDEAEASPDFELTVDLRAQQVLDGDRRWDFDVAARARRLLLDGLDDIEVTLTSDEVITGYERTRPHWMPRPSGARP